MKFLTTALLPFIILLLLLSCSIKGKNGLFAKKTDRQKYAEKLLKDSGKLNPIVNAWLNAAEFSLNNSLNVSNKFFEKGRFYLNDSMATSFSVNVKQGQKINVSLNIIAKKGFSVYMDMWEAGDSVFKKQPIFITASDTSTNSMEYVILKDQKIIIRFQQQLSSLGDYEFEINTNPLFYFPIAASVKSNIGSLWGDDRDAGVRKHEGIDIFASKKSPVVAVADGIISGVSVNELGGKVIFLRPENLNYNVYYAHLDSQLVDEGQQVIKGQTIGLVGNTGNARFTTPHLHFGIYTMSGAVDPLLFVKAIPVVKKTTIQLPEKSNFITARSTKLLHDIILKKTILLLGQNVQVKVHAVVDNFYRIVTTDGKKGFVLIKDLKLI